MEAGNAGNCRTDNGYRLLTNGISNNSSLCEADNIKRRYATFNGWSGSKSPIQLAISGFKYTGSDDTVVCDTCAVRMYNWEESFDAIEVHRTHSPNCAYIRKWFSPVHQSSSVTVRGGEEVNPPPKYPSYKNYKDRLDSYIGWPLKCDHQSPSKMAEAGFFYIGSADRARCFQCGRTLRDWDDEDIPLDAHITWSPECVFAQRKHREEHQGKSANTEIKSSEVSDLSETELCNGTAHSVETRTEQAGAGDTQTEETRSENDLPFGNVIKIEENSEKLCNGTVSNYESITKEDAYCNGGDTNTEGAIGGQVNSCDVTSGMRSAMIEAVLEFGCSMQDIKKAMETERKTTGKDFPDATSLYVAVMDIENNI